MATLNPYYDVYVESEAYDDYLERMGYPDTDDWAAAYDEAAIALSSVPWSDKHMDLLVKWEDDEYCPNHETLCALVKTSPDTVLTSHDDGTYTIYYKGSIWTLGHNDRECYVPYMYNGVRYLRLAHLTPGCTWWISDQIWANESGSKGAFVGYLKQDVLIQ